MNSLLTTSKHYIKRNIRKINHLKNSIADSSPKLIILVYHRVLPEYKFSPFNTIISLKTFTKQIDILAKKYPIIPLSDSVNQCKSGYVKNRIQTVLTFDDGYRDSYEIIYPILKEKGLPASFFIATDYINSSKPIWVDELVKILSINTDIRRIEIADKLIHQKIMQPRLSFIYSLVDSMKSLTSKGRQNILNLLNEQAGKKIIPDYLNDRCITWEQAKLMSANGMEIGGHGTSHSSLSRISFTEATQEIRKCKEIIENNIKISCRNFAFPFGCQKDYNQKLIDYVKDVGFQACLLNIHGYNRIKKDTFCFRRIIMEETTDLDYLLG
jgi:peptidoglycan/xylan/chitin deacetylase (PgdA/CDA1 family)